MTQITATVDELIDLLIDLSATDDTIKAIIGIAGNDDNRQIIIDYIRKKQEKGIIPDTSQLLKIAIYLAKNQGGEYGTG